MDGWNCWCAWHFPSMCTTSIFYWLSLSLSRALSRSAFFWSVVCLVCWISKPSSSILVLSLSQFGAQILFFCTLCCVSHAPKPNIDDVNWFILSQIDCLLFTIFTTAANQLNKGRWNFEIHFFLVWWSEDKKKHDHFQKIRRPTKKHGEIFWIHLVTNIRSETDEKHWRSGTISVSKWNVLCHCFNFNFSEWRQRKIEDWSIDMGWFIVDIAIELWWRSQLGRTSNDLQRCKNELLFLLPHCYRDMVRV